jgi:hypothetical protein
VKTIGILTTTVVAAATLYAAVLLVRSLPDIQRYLKIRSM